MGAIFVYGLKIGKNCVLFVVMNHRTVLRIAFCTLAPAILASFGMAQGAAATPPEQGHLDFESHLGAFKIFNANGSIHFSFKGTVLLRGYKGDLKYSSGIKQEYPPAGQDGHGRISLFGSGTLSFKGHWDAMQWLGKDLVGHWDGTGGYRLYGDYDRNLETGYFWMDGDQAHRIPWPTQSTTFILPQPHAPAEVKPVLKNKGQ